VLRGDLLRGARQGDGLAVAAAGQRLPRAGLGAPRRDLVVLRLTGELRGRPQVRLGRDLLSEASVADAVRNS